MTDDFSMPVQQDKEAAGLQLSLMAAGGAVLPPEETCVCVLGGGRTYFWREDKQTAAGGFQTGNRADASIDPSRSAECVKVATTVITVVCVLTPDIS